jgi:DNA-binding transcriptional ArsR family regulator
MLHKKQKKAKNGRKAKPVPGEAPRTGRTVAADSAVPCGPIPESLLMTRIDQLKSISVPVRMRILEATAEKPMTTKQVALQLGESITGLYRHVDALAEAGLLVPVAEVPKRGTVQKYFRAAAQRFVADQTCLPRGEHADPRVDTILTLIEDVRNAVAKGGSANPVNAAFVGAASSVIQTDPKSAAALLDAISGTIQKFQARKMRRKKRPAHPWFRITVFVSPDIDPA